MRALKIATIAMGVLILLGTAVIVATIIRRTISGPSATAPHMQPEAVAFAATLDEPAGTTIAAVTEARDRLAVQLRGGGPDRVILIDPATGVISGRITLTR